jgi:myo-inositol-1(or 4)-monophosphatase
MQRLQRCHDEVTDNELAALLALAGRAALEAGAIQRALYDRPHQISHKGVIDLVTEADVASEKKVLALLAEGGGHIGLISEESHGNYDKIPEGPVWIIDPLDGTTNFAHNFPWFAVSIAYAVGRDSKVGVIYSPILDELFCTVAGHGAWLNGRRIEVSQATELGHSLLATGFPYTIKEEAESVMAALGRMIIRCQGVRRAGAAALDLAYVAAGRLDGFWEINLKPWDTAAGILLVEEAGGRLSCFNGNSYTPYIPELAASNGIIHREMVEQLATFSRRPS